MTSETQFSRNPNMLFVLVAISVLMICVSSKAATTYEQTLNEHEFYLLQHYKLIYTEEIFDYCIKKYGLKGPTLRRCLMQNDNLKQEILNDALEQLRSQSLAQSIYDQCFDYHPMEGVGRISQCVRTRLLLDSRVGDDAVEKEIYKTCDLKWRKHGALAIDNCSRSESSYYLDKGVLRD